MEINGAKCALPPDWTAHIRRIRWIDETAVLVWPVEAPIGSRPRVGKIDTTGAHVLSVDYPLDVFSDPDLVAFTYAEDYVESSDLITIYSAPDLTKVARFCCDLAERFQGAGPGFLEVEHGVLDGITGRFWFSAYVTEYLWCFSVDKPRIAICTLGCGRANIVAITCRGDHASVVVGRNGSYGVRRYRHLGHELVFESESEAPQDDEFWRNVSEKLNQPSGEIRGYRGNMLALTSATSARLVEL